MNTAGSVLLDTSVVVAYFRGEGALRSRFVQAAALHLPWVVLGELHYGARRTHRRQEQLSFIQELLTYASVVFPDQSTTEHYGQMKAELAEMGKPIPDNDLWIAALAREHDLPVATRDAHFNAVPGLRVMKW